MKKEQTFEFHRTIAQTLKQGRKQRRILIKLKGLVEYCLGPTRDVKTPKLQECLELIKKGLK